MRWPSGTTEQAILTEAGRNWYWACSSRPRAAREPDTPASWDKSTVEPGFKARTKTRTRPGQAIAMECFLGGGSMASALVIVLESTFCVPGFPPSNMIVPRDLEWGQWAD